MLHQYIELANSKTVTGGPFPSTTCFLVGLWPRPDQGGTSTLEEEVYVRVMRTIVVALDIS